MADHSYILFNQTPVQLRLVGARGGRAHGRNQRARRALMRAQPSLRAQPSVPQRAAPRESTAQAMAALDTKFPWLCDAQKSRTSGIRPEHQAQIPTSFVPAGKGSRRTSASFRFFRAGRYPAANDGQGDSTMKAFSIDSENNITVHASREAAREAAGDGVFTSAGQLGTLAGGSGTRLVAIWNSLTGVKPVKKFMTSKAGARRIFAELQKLDAPVAPNKAAIDKAAKDERKRLGIKTPKAAKAPKAPTAAKARGVASAKGDGPRETSKNAQVIALAKRPQGVTLDELMAFGWQKHTARSLVSAGGSITKKYPGIVFISEEVDGVRTYFIRN